MKESDVNILIVDDDVAIIKAMDQYIKKSGYNAFTVSSAEEATEFLKKTTPQIVVTDIMLPGKNGLELTQEIKEKHQDVAVIVMTGYSADFSYEKAISKGADDFVFKPIRLDELILRLKRVLKEQEFEKEREAMLDELKTLAITDGLTRLYNSRHFYSHLEVELDRANRYDRPISLLLLDVDHFKEYNDNYGHLEGDKILFNFGKIIKECLRKMDSAYRYGGEEFTVILPETDGPEAVPVAQRIRKLLEKQKYSPVPGKKVMVTVSIGVTQYHSGEDLTQFVQRSDKAMYASKQKGRNKVTYFDSEEQEIII